MENNKTAGLVPLETLMKMDGNTDLFGIPKKEDDQSAEDLMKQAAENIDSSLKDKEGDESGDEKVDLSDLDNQLKNGKTDSEKQTLDGEEKEEGKNLSSSTQNTQYNNILKNKFGYQAIIQVVDGEEVEIPIDEAIIDEDTFATLIDEVIQQEKEEASKDKISTNEISDFAKNLIEIDKNGGDIRSLLEAKAQYLDPFDGLDMDTVSGQKQALTILMAAQGVKESEIRDWIEVFETKGTLAEKAFEAKDQVAALLNDAVETRKQQAKDYAEAQKQKLKAYKKSLGENLGSKFELKEVHQKKLVDFMTKLDEKGRYAIDERILEVRSKPDEAADLALFLLDKEEYLKQVTNKALKQQAVESAQKLKTIRMSRTEPSKFEVEKKKESKLIPLEKLGI
jgi:hypothetical protein